MNRTEFKARIEELRSLDTHGLDWLEEAFETKYPDQLPLPYLYLRLRRDQNDVVAELKGRVLDVDIDINLETKRALWLEWDEYSDDYQNDKQLDLSNDADWDWLINRLSYLHSKSSAEQRKE